MSGRIIGLLWHRSGPDGGLRSLDRGEVQACTALWKAGCKTQACQALSGVTRRSVGPMPAPSFTYTQHALEQIALRELDRAWVERTILTPDTTEPDPNRPDRMRAFRSVPEMEGRMLRVVFVVHSPETYLVITAFLDRGRRPKANEIPV